MDNTAFESITEAGLVSEMYNESNCVKLPTEMEKEHANYSIASPLTLKNIQPFVEKNRFKNIGLVDNGDCVRTFFTVVNVIRKVVAVLDPFRFRPLVMGLRSKGADIIAQVTGFLMRKELDYLVGSVTIPNNPITTIVGVSKVSTKIGVIGSSLVKVDVLLFGGELIFLFHKIQRYSDGSTLVEENILDQAMSLFKKAKAREVSTSCSLLDTTVDLASETMLNDESKS
ncbi:phosphoglycerate kinase, cytosolic-like [Durio zibethinus]|uniref:Phosphoglycerate kinase n=1 Tax=Durio zibethinus TaxID=66656 RepID=A0A6P5ZNU0_DURZI|nr:phosphoglycerate kinase, cytosolic-like [Durio zibethinus]